MPNIEPLIWKEKVGKKIQRALRLKLPKAILAQIGLLYYQIFKSRRYFIFQGKRYHYFYHNYNYTWLGERAVEIPVIWEFIKNSKAESILEVGNVLSHYFKFDHDILDKYERGHGVINQDILHFYPQKKYDLIVSVSTLEHVGWDETPRQSQKVLRAWENLKTLLKPRGEIIVTLPLGYNPEVDRLLQNNRFSFTKCFYLKRISRDNAWREVSWEEIKNSQYSFPFVGANGLVISLFGKR